MTAKLLLLVATSALLFSCKKDYVLPKEQDRLVQIQINAPANQVTTYVDYKYDSKGLLTEIASSASGVVADKQTLVYDASGKIKSNTLSNNVAGDIYRYDFEVDANGRINKAICTAILPTLQVDDHTYTYDTNGRLVKDSVFTKAGVLSSYVDFTYDNNDNVIAYQQYVLNGTPTPASNKMTFEYDNNKSPYSKIGQLLYTSLGGSGIAHFYLSKNNTIRESLNNAVITPGGKFIYQYYSNSLLRTSMVNDPNAEKFTFIYSL